MNMGAMLDLITNRMFFGSFTSMLMSNYIAFAQILGGILLILGNGKWQFLKFREK